jgi:hypothetical protein
MNARPFNLLVERRNCLTSHGAVAKGIMHRSSKDTVIGIVCIVLVILAAFGSRHVTTVHPDWWISKALVRWSQSFAFL